MRVSNILFELFCLSIVFEVLIDLTIMWKLSSWGVYSVNLEVRIHVNRSLIFPERFLPSTVELTFYMYSSFSIRKEQYEMQIIKFLFV